MKPTNHFSIVQRVWDETSALPRQGATDEERLANGAKFLKLVVLAIRDAGDLTAGLWRKDTPWGYDGDKICFKIAAGGVWFVDIIVNAGSTEAAPSWQDGDENYFPGDPQTNWMTPGGTPPPGTSCPCTKEFETVLATLSQHTAALGAIIDALQVIVDTQRTMAPKVDQAAAESFNAAVRCLDILDKLPSRRGRSTSHDFRTSAR